jgi:hypothetical protein
MTRDKLFLLHPGFEDPAYPGTIFYCWHCALIEGVLASFPKLAANIDVERVAWPRPRTAVVALLGIENQSLPVMILADGSTSTHGSGIYEGRTFLADKDGILAALSERHGFPHPHP